MSTKQLARVEIKDADQGTVEAVFSTIGVKDSDRDVTLDGAFEDGAPVVISAYGHTSWEGPLPVGKGTIRVAGAETILDGQFFLKTTGGRDTFETVKELGELQQWSYGYDVLKYSYGEHEGEQVRFLEKLKVHEVSPVLVGAGVGTRTLGTKAAGLKFGEEAEAVMAALDGLLDRAADVMAKRQEKGKQLGQESVQLLGRIEAHLTRLKQLTGDQPDDAAADLEREYLRFLRNQTS